MVRLTKSGNLNLNFAAIIRVSTERQKKTGESLRTQRTEIEQAVKLLGGTIVKWYGGQEHATPGFEKKEIDRLLGDVSKKKFNAVIVTDADRWSRDNTKSRQGLDLFEQYGIRFFIGTEEQDLNNEDHRLTLGIHAEIGQFFASKQKRKSLKNRTERAKRGIPTGGRLPFGRKFDKKTCEWDIDKEKRTLVEKAARRYLAGESLSEIAKDLGVNHANLHKVLTTRCGTEWELEFHSDNLNIHETVKLKIPRLLPEKTIEAIRKRAEANKTYHHGELKHFYLLSRMVFCKHCEYALSGQTNPSRIRYYRHINCKRRDRKCNQAKHWIPAEDLEDVVMRHLFTCFGNPAAIQKAIEKATPNWEKIKECEQELVRIEERLQKNKTGRERILIEIVKGNITDKQSDPVLLKLKDDDSSLEAKKQQLQDSLCNRPDPDKVKSVSKKVSKQFKKFSPQARQTKLRVIKSYYNHAFDKMTKKDKRQLVETVFSGKMPDGHRMGVWIEWTEKGWQFDLHGHLIDLEGLLPLSDYQKTWPVEGGASPRTQDELLTKSALYLQDRNLP